VKTGPLAMVLLAFTTASAASQVQLDELIARAKSFELDTPYVPPPGDPLAYHAAAQQYAVETLLAGPLLPFWAAHSGSFPQNKCP
jgi:hypothetical protein